MNVIRLDAYLTDQPIDAATHTSRPLRLRTTLTN